MESASNDNGEARPKYKAAFQGKKDWIGSLFNEGVPVKEIYSMLEPPLKGISPSRFAAYVRSYFGTRRKEF